MKSPFPEGYIGSTKCELDHRVGNNLSMARLTVRQVPPPDDFQEVISGNRADFIAGLTRAVEESFPVFGGVTHQNLTDVVNLASSIDWSNVDQLKQLSNLCGELRKLSEG